MASTKKSMTNQRKENNVEKRKVPYIQRVIIWAYLYLFSSQICKIPWNTPKIQTYSNSGSSKVIDLGANQKHICSFLLVINTNSDQQRKVHRFVTFVVASHLWITASAPSSSMKHHWPLSITSDCNVTIHQQLSAHNSLNYSS